MITNQAGVNLIKSFEGLRTKAYRCQADVLTIGYGHTAGVKEGQTVTADEAEQMLKRDIARFEACVEHAVTVKLTDNQFAALVSFTFNVGCGAFKNSTLLKKLNEGNYAAAAGQFDRWVNAGGKPSNGLVRRRKAEQTLFLKP